MDPFRLRGRLPVLDGLRGVAILVVFFHNVGFEQTNGFSPALKVLYFMHAPGWVGVCLFFALSGFLITSILADARGPGALRAFWVRRALRIFPLYYAVLLVSTVVLPRLIAMPAPFSGLEYRAWYWTYLCNWHVREMTPALGHFWSLAVEEQFYLVWPLLVLHFPDRTVLRVCVALAVVALIARIGLRACHFAPGAVYTFTITRMDGLTLGGAAAIVARTPDRMAAIAPRLRHVLVGCLFVLLGMWPLTRGFNCDAFWVQTVGYGVLAVFFAALVLETVRDPSTGLARALAAPWLRWLGKYSYAIYVFHLPIARLLGPTFHPSINSPPTLSALRAFAGFQILVAALSIGAALVSWNVLERWCLSLKDRVSPGVSRRQAPGAGHPLAVSRPP